MNSYFYQNLSLLATYFRPQWLRVLRLAFLLFGSIGLQLLNPQLVRYVLDTAQSGASQRQLLLAAALFILLGLTHTTMTFASTYIGENVSWSATNALRSDLALHCLHLDMGFHNTSTPGELIERVDGDVSELANFFSHLVLNVLSNFLLLVGVILMLYREDWRMGLATTLYALLTVVILQAVQNRTVTLWRQQRAASAAQNGFLEERMAGTEDIRANGGESYVLRQFALLQRKTYSAKWRAQMMGVFTFSLTHLLFALATVGAFSIGVYLFLNGQTTIGTLYLVLYYLSLLQWPLEQIRDQVAELQQSTASISRIGQLFSLQPAATERIPHNLPKLPQRLSNGSLSVDFDQVSFQYESNKRGGNEDVDQKQEGQPTVLHDISFRIEAGKVLGLLGRTGSGKTSLTRLLFRLYKPSQGSIRLGGQDIQTLNLHDLRQRIGMVTQEVQLFQATLRENVTLFNSQIHDRQILDVFDELGLSEWFQAQPNGLDTRLAANGSGFSAGEAQLLTFVRVFLKDPGLVILDEASSRLDPATEQLLERAIDRLLQNRTSIMIAHRLGTVQRADEIMVLHEGRIHEHGPREQLANDPDSHFAHLLQTGLEGTG
ncbi:ABC transporter ATP-binding protein/permease [Chloroflexi bacterium TSY]|nr:ABC transporter ATP-binding protein/permease [Chloroflexi bacterium TSY]